MIIAAREGADAAMASLCATYWRPLYVYVRRQGRSIDDAQDLTQGFFSHLLEKNSLRHVDPSLGRFRSFLLASLRNFLAGEWRRQHASRRSGGALVISLEDMTRAENGIAAGGTDSQTPEQIYERHWALALLERTITRLGTEFESAGKRDIFEHLKPFLPGEHEGTPYSQVAARLGINEVTVRVAVHRMRARFQDLLRDEVARTLPDPDDSRAIMGELRYLLSVL